jgi:carbamate kinase
MKVAGYISVLAITTLLLANVTNSVAAGGKGKNPHKQRGAVYTKNSSKQSTNQNAQWSADPDRGWVRSDDSHSINDRDRLSTAPKQTDGKNKASGKASKRF